VDLDFRSGLGGLALALLHVPDLEPVIADHLPFLGLEIGKFRLLVIGGNPRGGDDERGDQRQ
jgi:hypothetical protein